LVLDKPPGMTSRAALDRAAPWFPAGTRIGHAGTLDPLATGVLVLCVGVASRLVEYVQDMRKTYRTEFLLGATSDTDDADGQVTMVQSATAPNHATIDQALKEFVGTIQQQPPEYSAARVGGRRAHELARHGREVILKPRTVHVHRIDILDYEYPNLRLEVECGKGTYVRSLARDLGQRLKCGALVQTLRRLQVGPFRAEDGLTLNADPQSAQARLLPLKEAVADLPQLVLSNDDVRRLRMGQAIASHEGRSDAKDVAAALDESNQLAAIVRFDPGQKVWRPEKVMAL
jgi:tRNA pseudouridine55 synthase